MTSSIGVHPDVQEFCALPFEFFLELQDDGMVHAINATQGNCFQHRISYAVLKAMREQAEQEEESEAIYALDGLNRQFQSLGAPSADLLLEREMRRWVDMAIGTNEYMVRRRMVYWFRQEYPDQKEFEFNGHLTRLPEALGRLKGLESIFCTETGLLQMPRCALKNLTLLRNLSLGGNPGLGPSLTKCLQEKGLPSSLVTLCLSNIGLQNLPPEVGRLTRLRVVDLSHNFLSDLPQEMEKLSHLESLKLAANAFTQVPSVVKALPWGIALDMHKNALLALSTDLHDSEVDSLNVAGNKDLGSGIEQWVGLLPCSLTTLWASGIGLSRLPPVMKWCFALELLDLTDNNLSALPEEMCELEELEWLSLKNNAFEAMPEVLRGMHKLTYLCLSGNKITEGPSWLGEKLGLLETLHLKHNGLRVLHSVPSHLKVLTLQDNALKTVPLEESEIVKFERLDLRDNPLSEEEVQRLQGREQVFL